MARQIEQRLPAELFPGGEAAQRQQAAGSGTTIVNPPAVTEGTLVPFWRVRAYQHSIGSDLALDGSWFSIAAGS